MSNLASGKTQYGSCAYVALLACMSTHVRIVHAKLSTTRNSYFSHEFTGPVDVHFGLVEELS
jgi:hypothetical protein